jgi:hypothetical protein
MATVTCRTEGCENNGIPLNVAHPMKIDDNTGEPTDQPVDPWQLSCGPCGQPITDISEP